jgi:hypothetical protein
MQASSAFIIPPAAFAALLESAIGAKFCSTPTTMIHYTMILELLDHVTVFTVLFIASFLFTLVEHWSTIGAEKVIFIAGTALFDWCAVVAKRILTLCTMLDGCTSTA